MLGIEGVKIDVEVINPINSSDDFIKGFVKLTTLRDSVIKGVVLKVIEKYSRGRQKDKLIDEYTIGFLELDDILEVKKEDIIQIPFEIPFKLYQSEMDLIQNKNFFTSGLVKLAKMVKGVKSDFRIEAEAIVQGTKLNPLAKKEIIIQF